MTHPLQAFVPKGKPTNYMKVHLEGGK